MNVENNKQIRNLQILTALNSISYGIIYCFISPYLLKLGSSHVALGVLAVGNLIGDLLSSDVVNIFTHVGGKRYALFVILNAGIITNILLVLTDSVAFTILVRFLFCLTNQSQKLCQDLLIAKAENAEMKNRLQRNYNILSSSGFIIGPIISGYIFDIGFGYTGLLAACLCFLNVQLLMTISKNSNDDNAEHTDTSVLQKAINNVSQKYSDFTKCSPEKNWDLLLLKYLFASSVMIFFTKFAPILKHNYDASSVTIGYTGSYINAIAFLVAYYISTNSSKLRSYSLAILTETSFFFLTIFMFLTCYAPSYQYYLMFLTSVVFFKSLIISIWQDLFSTRNNAYLSGLNYTASTVAGLTTPLVFGFVCDRIAHQAVILFSCMPLAFGWIILKCYSNYVINETKNVSEKKDL
ncbi:hypothetical protein ABEB36_012143 [Hypothenemus hampei]|uniref:Uncharacterized protein n=1 Tax=Hypothenemus hampei TaxID=57062 RepID=A0ABD1EB08_HYPHA